MITSEASRQVAEMPREWSGRQGCCGATNPRCSTAAREVYTLQTGCQNCGHPLGCHVA